MTLAQTAFTSGLVALAIAAVVFAGWFWMAVLEDRDSKARVDAETARRRTWPKSGSVITGKPKARKR